MEFASLFWPLVSLVAGWFLRHWGVLAPSQSIPIVRPAASSSVPQSPHLFSGEAMDFIRTLARDELVSVVKALANATPAPPSDNGQPKGGG